MMKRVTRLVLLGLACLFLTACEETENYAPVMDAGSIEPIPKVGVHRVGRGESLYEIAWRYGLDYRALAIKNNIQAPYTIRQGQIIYLRQRIAANLIKPTLKQEQIKLSSSIPSRPIKTVATVQSVPLAASVEPNFSPKEWLWPAQGKLLTAYSSATKGINIAGSAGDPIVATAAGKVVYAGQGLRGYGNLIIIKHNALYLSAYAHNKRLLVTENSWVKKGQKIAEMGDTGANKNMLHFEIRRAGKPIDPTTILMSP